ncbi:MAG TPA: HAD hydrolase family protein, partial [Longimicrobiales bacterium]
IFQNGASLVQVGTGESRSRTLPAEAITRLVAEGRATDRVLELYADDEYVVESAAERARVHAGLLGVPFRARPLDSLRKPIVRAQWVVSPEDADEIVARDCAGLSIARSLSPVMQGTAFVALTAAGVDKASGVEGVARAYGLELPEVMMVGDAENDLVALRVVGWPVAMGNAEATVRAAARNVVGHVDDGGLIEALELAERGGS